MAGRLSDFFFKKAGEIGAIGKAQVVGDLGDGFVGEDELGLGLGEDFFIHPPFDGLTGLAFDGMGQVIGVQVQLEGVVAGGTEEGGSAPDKFQRILVEQLAEGRADGGGPARHFDAGPVLLEEGFGFEEEGDEE